MTELTTTLNSNDGIMAGKLYIITIVASTMIGPGPPSMSTMQKTIMQPISISTGDQSITVNTNAITQNTIPIILPSIPGASFSHFWVIAMKVDNAFAGDIRQNNTVRFSNNNTFTMYSDNIPLNTPYIVAEISALNISDITTFVLGDERGTERFNDELMYRNGPLTQGTQYTAFLWGFPPSVAVSWRYNNHFYCSAFSCLKLTKTILARSDDFLLPKLDDNTAITVYSILLQPYIFNMIKNLADM